MGRIETPAGGLLRSVGVAAFALCALAFAGCTLITDVDREKIPVEQAPPFPDTTPDGGADAAAAPDAAMPEPTPIPEAGIADAGGDAGEDEPGDAGPEDDAAAAGDAG